MRRGLLIFLGAVVLVGGAAVYFASQAGAGKPEAREVRQEIENAF